MVLSQDGLGQPILCLQSVGGPKMESPVMILPEVSEPSYDVNEIVKIKATNIIIMDNKV